MNFKYDIGIVSNDLKVVARCKEIAETYSYTYQMLDRGYDFRPEETEFRLIVVGGADFQNGGEFTAFLKQIRTSVTETFIIFVETKNSVENSVHMAKEYGADLALSELEFFETSKPDYIFSQVIRATYLPIKSTDIVVNRPIDFDIYHLLPQREKFLKFCFVGDVIDQKKLEKIKSVDELYIHRKHADEYAAYINTSSDTSEDGLNRRCRSQFLALYAGYMKLVLALTDQSEKGTYKRGVELFGRCRELAITLLGVLATHPDPWIIIHTSTIGDFGSVERGPAVAAYAGIIGLKMGFAQVEDMMIAALVSELGLLFLPRKITGHVRNDTLDQLTPDEANEYFKYPLKSLAIALDRRLQLTEQFRNIAFSIHERADKLGFPKRRFGRTIPMESFAIHFAYQIDRRVTVRMGKARVDLETVIRTFLAEELSSPSHFTLQFLHKLKIALKPMLQKKSD